MKNITADELHGKLKDGEKVTIIDVREESEVATGKIPGAKHIPSADIPYSLDKLDKNEHYYIVCHAGGRSSAACEFLINQGYDVTNMTGGMLAWKGEKE
ncbi:rhodanese-like domain-containing protein [Caldibacillus lycopersici]|uniref:Rhodanese-like domain-containing protein n=1 Tax=Perspicuibacillus lycopersici TaxID=1325689 RepID=A0AAE3IXZ8_9BACI|nr:rhodanese-like domain-containing protein [Perspicuibacillus lycopersici]MCU9614999.1 rhodanese-like domain-containing protein [Perspicuibacillus lycopersici]